ncbi:hypothetical protein SAMN02949497_1698 [Methylomagnum ishizawai]|uniref:Effector-associated domain-containing protein n=1 Tax=Methylomagnum ishizawai TaxID=1760988 RepID=A0A1Y6D331_9GAMM|nr:effector-associated domain EAD1-containing protein [Methylomagnum ishizawai]SMF94385.1 hypothetical protein SAMN02949497_1698 [Methylomagnum ishizawai]
MTLPLRASYGAVDNRHDLLDWDGKPGHPPAELLGLTDKPPGYLNPGERWWPCLGCGPVEGGWALWWTEPDENTRRGGMVRSEVALWPLDAIGNVADLRPFIAELAGGKSIPPSNPGLLLAVAEALVAPSAHKPPVLPDLEAWPGVVADVWARLWPEARRAFAARIAINPPRGGESACLPWLYGIPAKRAPEWIEHRTISPDDNGQPSRAAAWLVGNPDATLKEILESCERLPAKLDVLSIVARAADRLDKLRGYPNPQNAVDLLRSLAVLAPSPEDAINPKLEALRELARGFADTTPELVRSLMNIDPANLPTDGLPHRELRAWVGLRAPTLSPKDAAELLEKLAPGIQAKAWWREGIREAFTEGLTHTDSHWAKAAIRWMGIASCGNVLGEILPMTEATETRVLNAAADENMAGPNLEQIRVFTQNRAWSRLHAWAAMKGLAAREAFQAQRQFPNKPLPGLEFLVERLPGPVVVEEAIANPDSQTIQLVARRTSREPDLLRPLDVAQPAWRTLWAAHVAAKGTPWPPGANREILGNGLLDSVMAGNEPAGLIAVLARDLGGLAFAYPKRAELWRKLSREGQAALLAETALALLRACETGAEVFQPEMPLAEEVVRRMRAAPSSARVMATVLPWDVSLSEREFIQWLHGSSRTEWLPTVSAAIGRAIGVKHWKNAAEAIYDRWKPTWRWLLGWSMPIPEYKPALEMCYSLLSLRQCYLAPLYGIGDKSTAFDEGEIIRQVANLGADIAPDSLEDIWERAGGKRKQLKEGGTPATRWREAANMASQAALKDGLLDLLRVLEEERPHNEEIQKVKLLVSSLNKQRKR